MPITDQQRLLASRIADILLAQAIAELNIQVTVQEIEVAVDKCLARGKVGEAEADQVRVKSQAVVDALRDVIQGKNPGAIYNDRLKGLISQAEWNVWVENYNAKDKVGRLAGLVPKSLADMKAQTPASVRKDLERQKLVDKLTQHIKLENEEIEQEYRRRYPSSKPTFGEVADKLRKQLRVKKQTGFLDSWWNGRVEKAEVKILSEELGGTLKLLKKFLLDIKGAQE